MISHIFIPRIMKESTNLFTIDTRIWERGCDSVRYSVVDFSAIFHVHYASRWITKRNGGSMKILARMDDRIYRGWKHKRVLEILHFWSFYFRVSGNFCITTNLENIFYVSLFMEKYPFIIQSIRILIRCSQNVVDWLNSSFLPGIESFSERLLVGGTGNRK